MAADRQRGLGRGLAALLGEAEEARPAETPAAAGGAPRELPIEALERNEQQPRQMFDEAALEELAASVRERGVLQPILVRPLPGQTGRFQIVAGERRWRAAQRAGLHAVPVIVRELDDAEVLEVAIVENVQRADLDPIEEAFAYRALMDRFGHKQDDVARIVGKSRSHVANTLRLTSLPQPVVALVQSGALTAGHARALINAPEPERLAAKIVADALSVRETETLVRTATTAGAAPKRPRVGSGGAREKARGGYDTRALEQDLAEMLGVPSVEIVDRGGRGELRLGYASVEQLDDLCERLTRPVFGRG